MAATSRQQHWLNAAAHSEEPASTLFHLLAQPNERERGHTCNTHAVGFRRDGRRGFKCGVCSTVIKWVDPPVYGPEWD
jgi:hypothetical protein